MKTEKQYLIDEIQNLMDQHGSFVVMRYLGLSANDINEFRNKISGLGGNIEMMRKRILVKAAQEKGINFELKDLEGHIGLVFAGKDHIETTKAVVNYQKETDKRVKVVAGWIDGQLYSAADVDMLSKLPDQNQMRAQLLSVFQAPLTQTLATMNALLTSVPYCLENKAKQEGGES